ncbi:MAG: TRAP transporter small permease subunit [Pseudomonadota bacterium]|nr:TRAP transporter small permease subunit [Gammaproteobacteria bacterium]MBU1731296.1 TRAP transporter small permease subunit [Gammaproteobacteria bacterium]MBU1892801.1 TRAP transporter small permease subunit [Gammaproteobacteria bacterium]
MKFIANLIDALNEHIGRAAIWLVLLSALVSAGNAGVRYLFGMSSNGMLEIQWYMFSLIFLLCAGYTLKHDGHVRIDVIYGRLSKRSQAVIDVFGALVFLLPVALFITKMSWDMFLLSYQINEVSPDAGGLLRWPIKLAIPVGFALLSLQGISEIIKKILFLLDRQPSAPAEAHDERVA